MDLKPVGIWTGQLDYQPANQAKEAVAELEELGYGAVWVGEAVGREALSNAGLLLSATRRLVVATGIANIWVRDALAMVAGQNTLAEAYPERFLLGLGVSHAPLIEGMRGHHYERPLAAMRQYLDAMDEVVSSYRAVPPGTPPPRVLAALGPKMLTLAAKRAQGAHSYFVPPEHTAQARDQLGPDSWLIPEQAVVLENDSERAREIARRHTSRYLRLPNYTNNLRRLGFGDEDLAGSGSDRLVDAMVAWGDENAIVGRVRAHLNAGADHVCVQVLDPDRRGLPAAQWRRLAPALLETDSPRRREQPETGPT
jgi:probable F420-dependent oxidoreductase